MAAERPPPSDDPAEAVARVSAAKRDVLLRVHRHRLGFEDLEDCFSPATLELMARARTRARAFVSEAHIADALEQRFLSRISDRRRAVSGRSPIQAATHAALRPVVNQAGGGETSSVAAVADPVADVATRLAERDDVRRLRELADELTADQRLVLACQVAPDMDCKGSSGERWACRCQCRAPRSFVASERLGLEPSAFGAIVEDMGDPDCGCDPLDPALHQLEVRVVAQAEVVQPRSLGPGNVTGRGIALRVRVCVVPDEGLPVLVTRPFDRLSNLFPGECHGAQPPLHSSRSGRLAPTLPTDHSASWPSVWPGRRGSILTVFSACTPAP